MEFAFSPLSVDDIAGAIGKRSIDIRLTTYGDGAIIVETPDLTTREQADLRGLLQRAKGMVERSPQALRSERH